MFERSEFRTFPFYAAHKREPEGQVCGRLLLLTFSWRSVTIQRRSKVQAHFQKMRKLKPETTGALAYAKRQDKSG
jgi:hypothetical protein